MYTYKTEMTLLHTVRLASTCHDLLCDLTQTAGAATLTALTRRVAAQRDPRPSFANPSACPDSSL